MLSSLFRLRARTFASKLEMRGGIGLSSSVALFGLYMVVFLFSLTIHEAAHAWTAERFGDPTGRYLGRVSLNPMAHIDLFGTILFPAIGFFSGGLMFGWAKPVPWNPLNVKDRRKADIWISAAGPLSNLLAMVGFILLWHMVNLFHPAILSLGTRHPGFNSPMGALVLMCQIGIQLNLVLAVFNMIPIPPLDGSHILPYFLPRKMAEMYDEIRPYGFIILLAFLYLGVFSLILLPFWMLVSFFL